MPLLRLSFPLLLPPPSLPSTHVPLSFPHLYTPTLPCFSLPPGPTSPFSFPKPKVYSYKDSVSPSSSFAVGDDIDIDIDSSDIGRLLELLPGELRQRVVDHPDRNELVEIVMDLGRRPLARFPSGDFFLSDRPISAQDILHATSQVGDFGEDNRAGISRTLHRISAIRNRKGTIIGLTCRVGRAVTGSANLLRDLVKDGSSLLVIGPPGVGKTTIIREIARMLADDYKKRVMIVDTSNEIAGDGDIPHPGIGGARRLQVPDSDTQHKVLIEAVENHMPQVIVIDEIGTKLEAMAASTIAQRGIQLVATAHGVTIENLVMNPSLEMLVGGIQSVTLGDEEASRRGVQKTVLERQGPSTFTCGVEIISKTELRVHSNLEATVDALLSGRAPYYEVRKFGPDGPIIEIPVKEQLLNFTSTIDVSNENFGIGGALKHDFPRRKERSHDNGFLVCAYGISEKNVSEAIMQLGMDEIIKTTDDMSEADALLALSSKIKKNQHIEEFAKSRGIPIFVTKTNTLVQVRKAVRALVNEHVTVTDAFDGKEQVSPSEKADALEEARLAIEKTVIPNGESVLLLPRSQPIISAQIELIESFRLKCKTVRRDNHICLRILPLEAGDEENGLYGKILEGIEDLSDDGENGTDGSQNGVARLRRLLD
ncbi:P-loop containing nucleoside triphosphate hydrolases superfamily protein [Rhynchospora pubera]|uniref:P-loop containing nucleoside triphosphate hydrolases superfamily protein n=1 Tax=Rhynchospora pubera TaxID=906938 RepID=A0AAV8G1J3_9POAL|nr:P-loop containing nucleoside triphosphate hydrolases superfamily protein [Rhynchospora pubera]